MTQVEGLDFAWTKPSPAQVLAAGGHWIAGYFSTDTSKNLNRSNIPPFLSAGIPVVTVWETTTGRATQGRQAGVDDARAAEAERIAAGLPSTHVHHFAVDEDTSWSSVVAYFDGVISVLGVARVGCYGGYPVIVGAHGHGIRYLWQTVAWSGGQWASFATIRQPGGMLLGGSADVDFSEVPDFGQTPRPVTPGPTTPSEDTMPQWINGSVTPGTVPVVAGVPAGTAWAGFPHRTLHLGMDEPGAVGAKAMVRVAVHKGGADWEPVRDVPVTAKGGTVGLDITGAVKISLQTVSPGVCYSVETW
jgi:hypothetical protein